MKGPRRLKRVNTEGAAAERAWPAYALLLIVTLTAYSPAWRGGPVWDDDHHLTAPALESVDGLRRIWSEPGATQQYYPITHSAFWLMDRLWGDEPLGYHLVNITLHALSAMLVLASLRRLDVPGAALAAFVFALHPVHVESVAWMTELKNTLSGVFYLSAAAVYLRFDRDRRRSLYLAAVGLFVLALFSKSVTATLPAAMLVVFWWRRGTVSWRHDVWPLAPFFAIGVASGLATAWVERTLIGAQGAEFAFSAMERVLIAGRAIWFYVGKLLWPLDLSFSYPRWQIDATRWVQFVYPAAVAGTLAIFWRWRARTRAPLAAALLFAGTLVPALGFVNVYPFRFSFVADHFQYLASISVISATVAGLAILAARAGITATSRMALGAILAIGLGVLTWRQSHEYADAETLYKAVLTRNPASWLALTNLGKLELERDPNQALGRFEEALRLKPDLPEARNNLGNALQRLGRHQEALLHYREAVRLDAKNAIYQTSLASALRFVGRVEESAAASTEALRLDPGSAEAHYNLASARRIQGRDDEAVAEYREVVRLNPRFGAAYYGLGQTLFRLEKMDDAVAAYRSAVGLTPNLAVVRNDLAVALSSLGRYDEAVSEFGQAIRLQADYAEAYFNLGSTLQRAGRTNDAVEAYRRALGLRPADAAAHNNLGVALESLGRRDDAAAHFAEALRLNPSAAEARANLARVRRR